MKPWGTEEGGQRNAQTKCHTTVPNGALENESWKEGTKRCNAGYRVKKALSSESLASVPAYLRPVIFWFAIVPIL